MYSPHAWHSLIVMRFFFSLSHLFCSSPNDHTARDGRVRCQVSVRPRTSCCVFPLSAFVCVARVGWGRGEVAEKLFGFLNRGRVRFLKGSDSKCVCGGVLFLFVCLFCNFLIYFSVLVFVFVSVFFIDLHRSPTCHYPTCLINTSKRLLSDPLSLPSPPFPLIFRCVIVVNNDGHVCQRHPE